MKYTFVNEWYDSSKIKFGQVGGIAIDTPRNRLYIFHRASQMWQAE